jgi:hypothetical protein
MNWIWTLLWFLVVIVVGIIARPFWDEYSFQILTIVVFLNAGATITLWQRAARRPEKLKKKFLNQLWHSKPITPKHQPPAPLKPDEWGINSRVLQFFSDFEDFANVVNWWLSSDIELDSPWRLQELPKSRLSRLGPPDSPSYGRRYAVFHNQIRIGEIEIEPHWEYSTENPRVRVHIELDWARLLTLRAIRDFLVTVALHVSEYHPGTLEYLQTNQAIDLALIKLLWTTQEISRFGLENEPGHGEIEVELDGLATFYLRRRQGFPNQAVKQNSRSGKQRR